MKPLNNVPPRSAMLLPLVLLLTACASKFQPSCPAPSIPPLPPEARQPATPSECLPTCSKALMSARESWQKSLTSEASPASSANAITTR
ncbi:hypothetical protein B7759_01408 [Burkholderia glumae]|nr:hypothetical protein B7759_01408 [Burkholderia glumae]